MSQILSPAKAPASGSYAASPMLLSLLLSSDLYLNLQKVFFSCKKLQESSPPPPILELISPKAAHMMMIKNKPSKPKLTNIHFSPANAGLLTVNP